LTTQDKSYKAPVIQIMTEQQPTNHLNNSKQVIIPQMTHPGFLNAYDWKRIAAEKLIQISIFHIIFLVLTIGNWMTFAIIKLNRFSHSRKVLSFKEKLANYGQLLLHSDIFPLVWNLICGIIAILHKRNHFVYSLQLFTIFNLFPTMQSVIYSVRVRYKQFISATLLILIIILFYSSVSFYLFRNQFMNGDENLCDSFLHCFLTLINNGIRAGQGFGFPIKSINDKLYYPAFIAEWLFYFSIILIMLNIINGIIVDTFQALREQNNLKSDIQENVCYICSLNRSKFEIKGINFNYHKYTEHNILNYFFYIFKLQLTDEQDLNSLDYQVLNSIKDLRTDFFPVKKALSLGDLSNK
jgi:hypothetical protein